MTLKYGFLGLPQGGAKGSVRGDPEGSPEERRAALVAFARAAAPLLRSGVYLPDTDLGTRNEDVRFVLDEAGVVPKRREWHGERSGEWTAATVLAALEQTAARMAPPLDGARVAIEGFGAVGSALARMVAATGARVVAVSTSRGSVWDERGFDIERVSEAADVEGADFVRGVQGDRAEPDRLLELDVDYLCPCAVGSTIHAGNVAAVLARAIVPGANAPVSPEAERALHERGVVCVPDFLSNCGGVLGGTMEFTGIDGKGIREFVRDEVGPRIGRILDRAAERGRPPREVAEPIAEAAHETVRREAESEGPGSAVSGLALELHRRALLPTRLVARAAAPWFRRAIADVP